MWNQSKTKIIVTWIRHGKTKANEEGRYLGWGEQELSPQGISKLKAKMARGHYPKAELLLVSPMIRCKQTAKLIYPDKEWVEVPEWKEMNFGRFEGKNYQELNGDVEYQAWIDSNGTLPFPEGESREEFITRCERGMREILPIIMQQAESKKSLAVAAVVHGGTIMALMSRFAGGEYFAYQCKNGEGYCCELSVDGKEIVFLNAKRI